MKRALLFLAMTIVLSCCSQAVADTFRCGAKTVQVGDSEVSLLNVCGEPARKVDIEGSRSVFSGARVIGKENYHAGQKWYYNKGPKDFIYVITVVDGVITRIETAERGY